MAGRRAGLAGSRSGLWHEFRRILGELAPRWCVIENVPGLLSSNEGRDFGVVVNGLVELGYRVTWRVLDAQYFGLAQRRKRVFIVGSLGDGASAPVLLEPESLRGNPPSRRSPGEGVAGTLTRSLERGSADEGERGTLIASGLRASDGHHGYSSPRGDGADNLIPFDTTQIKSAQNRNHPKAGDPMHPLAAGAHAPAVAFAMRGREGGAMPELCGEQANALRSSNGGRSGEGLGAVFVPQVAWALQERDAKGADSDTKDGHLIPVLAAPLTAGGHPNSNAPGRRKEDDVNIVVADPIKPREWDSSNHEGRPHNIVAGVRRLTPLECERLQGFPDGWTEGFSDSTRYKMLGNAVAVPVAEWIARRMS